MPDISSIGHGSVGPVDRPSSQHGRNGVPAPASAPAPAPERPGDRVELSDHARLLDQLRRTPESHSDRLASIRAAIADGSYETDSKLGFALDRLIDDVNGA